MTTTIVDALVVTLGLDATGFKKGQKEINAAWQKTKTDALKNATNVEESNKKLLDGFNKLKVEALGFFAALLGAKEIKDFVANVNLANAAVGRLATNIGESPQMLSAWGSAVERFGGKSEEAATSLTSLSKAFYDLKYNGKALPPEIYRIFATAGKPVDTSHGLDKFLNDTAGALKQIAKTDRTAAFFFGQGMGLTPAMISLMIQYGDATSKFVNSLKDLSATDGQIKNAEVLIEKWSKLEQTTQQIKTDIENWFAPSFMKILDEVQSAFDAIHRATGYMGPQDLSPTKRDLRHDLHLDRWDKGGASGGGSSGFGRVPDNVGAGGGSGYYKGDQQSRILSLMDRLVNVHGWTPEAAAIAAGNAVQESNVLPTPVGDGGRSFGMFQWNGARLAALKAYGGDKWQDPNVQADFMAQEAENKVPGWKGVTSLDQAGAIGHAYEGYGDNSEGARVRDAREALAVYNARKNAGSSSSGPVVFGDSIAAGLKDYGKTQGAAVVGMGSGWITRQIQNYGGSLKGRKIILSSGASNSRDPNALAAEIYALKQKGVDPKNIVVLGVGDRRDFAGFNDTLKDIATKSGATFQPISPGADHVHPSSYQKLWQGISGPGNGIPANGVPLSSLQTTHPVTTSSTSNAMHVGSIHVNAPQATDANGIASSISDALGNYGFAMMGQSGQV